MSNIVAEKRSGNPPWMQFSLRLFLVAVALLAASFSYLAYFRSAEATINYQVRTLPTKELEKLGFDFRVIDGSPYRYALLTQSQQKSLATSSSDWKRPIHEKRVRVHTWPKQSDSNAYNATKLWESTSHPKFMRESGTMGGFLGIRQAGRRLELRLDFHSNFRQDDQKAWAQQGMILEHSLEGLIFYEGTVPEHGLVFAAAVNQETHHVVVFHIEQSSDGALAFPLGKASTADVIDR